ncbi:MAG: aminopeptidase P family protein, partial [Alphaproteobacteria bacterium]|nr:aminopeptidase P family protein [Alphaproteobacteria bacterium]
MTKPVKRRVRSRAMPIDLALTAKRSQGVGLTDVGGSLDMARMRAYRLGRLRAELGRMDIGACVLFDPSNIRYATGSRNMHIYTLRLPLRYAFVPISGPVVLFDYFGSEHLAANLETIAEVRPAVPWDLASAGEQGEARVQRFAAEIVDLMRRHCGRNRRVALDMFDHRAARALEAAGAKVCSAEKPVEMARQVKSPDEIACMNMSVAVCETALARMRRALEPGMTENRLWAILHETNIAMGGEWIETRLLVSGGRTNPWFQESSDRVIRDGDLVAIDTDLFGPFGYGCDMSRTWRCGGGRPSDEQRRLYQLAHENVEHNIGKLRAGMTFGELVEQSWSLPDEFVPRRYSKIAHGVGVGFEFPNIPYRQDWADYGYGGIIQENMVLCFESYIGREDGAEGVKLEQ